MTNTAIDRLWDAALGGQRYRPAAYVEVGLSLERANRLGLVVEPPADAGYRRVRVPNDQAHFPSARAYGGMKSNARPIVFPVPTGDWGDVRSVFVREPGPSGIMLGVADLAFPATYAAGSKPATIPTAGLRWGSATDPD